MNLSPLPVLRFYSNVGQPLVGGKLFSYIANTTTKIDTYQNQSGTPNTNPVILNFRGECNLWLDPTKTYKLVLAGPSDTDPPANPIWSVDNISGPFTIADLTQQIIGSILYPRTAAEISAGVVPTNYGYPPGDVRRYGAVGNGSLAGNTGTDDSAAFNAASSIGGEVIVDGQKIYRIGADVTLNAWLVIRSGCTVSVDSAHTLTSSSGYSSDSVTPFSGNGGVSFSTVSHTGRVLNVLPERAAGVPVYAGCTADSFGDSITAGLNATGPSFLNAWAPILGSRLGCTFNNWGQGGTGSSNTVRQGYLHLPKYGSRRRLITWMAGFNDLSRNGTAAANLAKITDTLTSFLANALLKTAVPASDSSVTKTGSWVDALDTITKASLSFGASAKTTVANNDTISWTFTGDSVCVGLMDSNGSTYTLSTLEIRIDGTLVESYNGNGRTDNNPGADTVTYPEEQYFGLTQSTRVFTGLGSGSHTIEVKNTSTNRAFVDFFGTLCNPSDAPSILVGEVPYMDATGYSNNPNRSRTVDRVGRDTINAVVDRFILMGYPVARVPVNDYYDANTQISSSDHAHPTVAGHLAISQAYFSRVLQACAAQIPSCSFTKNATQSIATATNTVVTWSGATGDLWGFRDATNTSRILAPFTGTMRLCGVMTFAANITGNRVVTGYKNGSPVRTIANALPLINGQATSIPFCGDFDVVAGDYLELSVAQDSGGNLNVTTNSQVDVAMIR